MKEMNSQSGIKEKEIMIEKKWEKKTNENKKTSQGYTQRLIEYYQLREKRMTDRDRVWDLENQPEDRKLTIEISSFPKEIRKEKKAKK